jgi:SAM-dependent methyltransferase
MDIVSHHGLISRWLGEHRDLLLARAGSPSPDLLRTLEARGWDDFLLSLDEGELAAFERDGSLAPMPARAPASFRDLCAQALVRAAVPSLEPAHEPMACRRRPHEKARKHIQVDAFAALVSPLAARARRVVDVGSGHGHLTRALASRVRAAVVGLERDPTLARRARELASDDGPSFESRDVLAEGLALEAGDCGVGLHA